MVADGGTLDKRSISAIRILASENRRTAFFLSKAFFTLTIVALSSLTVLNWNKTANRATKSKSEIACMTRDCGTARKLYSSPSLEVIDVGEGRADLEAHTLSHDPSIEESGYWLRVVSMLVTGSIPLAILVLTRENNIKHYASLEVLLVFSGCWAIFALWIILDKGPSSVMTKDAIGKAWLLLGLSNLIGAVLLFSYVHGASL